MWTCPTDCPRCKGTGRVLFTAKESLGGKIIKTWTYEAECPRLGKS